MPFDLTIWKQQLGERLKGWRGRMQAVGVGSVYGAVSAAAVWPVIAAARGGEWAAIYTLGGVVGGLGSNLLANEIQAWKDNLDLKDDMDVAGALAEAAQAEPGVRDELDAVLTHLDAIPAARDASGGDDARVWFEQTLRRELETLGNLAAHPSIGSVAQNGRINIVAVDGGSVQADTIVVGDYKPTLVMNPAPAGEPSVRPDALRDAYLRHVYSRAVRLNLEGIDPKAASGSGSGLALDAVYTALGTLTPEHVELPDGREDSEGKHFERVTRRFTALEQLNRRKHLVLQGDPGSGKSTFVKFVALCLAGEALGSAVNLESLTAPPPRSEPDGEEPETVEDGVGRQPWDHGALLPVPVELRDFAVRGLPPRGSVATLEHLWSFLTGELAAAGLADYAPHLRRHLEEVGGLVLLDGLDEVPEADERRVQIKQVVECLANFECRVLVTSRTYAYQKQGWDLAGFAEAVLTPFNGPQIAYFVDHWYDHIAGPRGMTAEEATGKALRLKRAIEGSRRLMSLAERPLLLTLMASLHGFFAGTTAASPTPRLARHHDRCLARSPAPGRPYHRTRPIFQNPYPRR